MPGAPSRRCGYYLPSGGASVSKFPLAVSGNGRYIVDAQGAPFLLHAEIPWTLNMLGSTDMLAYLDNAQAAGVTGLRLMGPIRWNGAPWQDANGNDAFATPDDFTTSFVTAYWDYYDTILSAARSRGIYVLLAALYAGRTTDEGWQGRIAAKTTGDCTAYGVAIATRLAAHTNLGFEGRGDYNGGDNARYSAIVAGIRSVSPSRLLTAELERTQNSDINQPSGGNWDLEFTYPQSPVHPKALDGWNANVGPCFMGEPYYEDRLIAFPPVVTTAMLRASYWQSLCCGNYAFAYGNDTSHHLWGIYDPGWVNDPGRANFTAMRTWIMSSGVAWHRLVPDQSSALVTAGRGTLGTDAYVTAASAASPQNDALIHIPTGAAITVALSGFSGSVTATWVDPASGAESAASGSPFAASGTHVFTASSEKGNNSVGAADWILRLRS